LVSEDKLARIKWPEEDEEPWRLGLSVDTSPKKEVNQNG
jgi:hypothetical protein